MATSHTKLQLIFVALFLFIAPCNTIAALFINEVLVSNNSINYDPHFFNFVDWIEIYNDGNTTVNLKHFTITDDINSPDKYAINFDVLIEPHCYYVIWADDKNWYPHTNFALDSDGEFVALFDPAGVLIDSFSFGKQLPDISYGRYPDGSTTFLYMPEPSPNKSNKQGIGDVNRISEGVIFSQDGGFYSGSQTVELSTLSPTAEIRYTLDGSWPDAESEIYTSPISISENTVIRSRSFDAGYLPSRVYTETFFVNQETSLPVVSISTDPDYFFNDRYGIYVVGTNGVTGNCTDYPVNYNQPWERSVNFEYFSPEGECKVNQILGTKIAGRCSRTRSMKSLGFYSRKKYGTEGIDGYQFFNSKELNSPKNLLLRNSGTEAYSTYLRDGFMQTLIMGRMDMDYQAYQPAVLYINGDYWGIHNLREKMNEHYVNSNYGVDPQSIDLLEFNTVGDSILVIQGDRKRYDSLFNFISVHDLRVKENYDFVKSQMDMNEFMNIHIANIYFENEDWPNNNNKFWRKRTPDGKWRWYMFDLDFGFGYWPKSGNTVKYLFRDRWYTKLAYKLKSNEEFKNEFVQRMASHLNTTFQTERVLYILDSVKGNISEEMHNHINRWGSPYSYSKWVQNLQVMIDFANGRTPVVKAQMMEEFGLTGTYDLAFVNEDPLFGSIQIAGVDVPNDYHGFYFDDVPLRIQAIPGPGYKFSCWSGDINSTDKEIFLTASSDKSISAHFETAEPIENLYINEFLTSNSKGVVDDNNEHEDWIEIHNANDYGVNLAGFYITDSAGFLKQYQIPYGHEEKTTVPPHGYILLWADSDPKQGIFHLPFKLDKSGERVILSQLIGEECHVLDSVSYSKQYTDVTYGRDPVNKDQWKFLEPTPEAENHERKLENIFINEFMASNNNCIHDTHGDFDDWIELYNANDYAVNIAGAFISDDHERPAKFRIPDLNSDSTTIPAHGYMLLWADDSTEQGLLHLNFKLSGSGEPILLIQPNGLDILDSVTFGNLYSGASYGRISDGEPDFGYMLATPGETNNAIEIDNIFINELLASNSRINIDEFGERDDWVELYNANDYAVNVAGMFITDKKGEDLGYRIPESAPGQTAIPPHGYLLIWFDDSTQQGVLHTDLKLSKDGEQLALYQPDGIKIADSISFGEQYSDISYGRTQDGSAQFSLQVPTPGTTNRVSSYEGIMLSEIMASDHNRLADEFGEFDDWIEIYNASKSIIDIAGMFVTDSVPRPERHIIPGGIPEQTTIEPGEYLILWADKQPEQGVLHLDFGLRESGEQVALFDINGRLLDSLTYFNQYNNFSFSKLDGDVWIPVPPTPGKRNIVKAIRNIVINEYMSDNENRLLDEYGEYDDWIEIYNKNDFPVDLGGLYLSDSIDCPDKYRIPGKYPEATVIPAKGYIIVWIDSDSKQGPLHTNFKLSRSGDELILSGYDYRKIIDSVTFDHQYSNFSTARLNDKGPWIDMPPTPATSNILPDLSRLFINEIMTSNEDIIADNFGEFDDWIEVYNDGDEAVDLGGLFVSDSFGDLNPHRISSDFPDSTTVLPGNYLLFWADDSKEQGILHTGFKLSRSGEQVVLYSYDGLTIIDSITYEKVSDNMTFGRFTDGKLPWEELVMPTPRKNNCFFAELKETRSVFEEYGCKLYPNPASDNLTISLNLRDKSEVIVKIYDHTGKLAAVPVKGVYAAGQHNISWDLRNGNGKSIDKGIYIYVLDTGYKRVHGKLVILDNH
ncbi:MAG: lamin tail domain-containing protein [Bacteroidales bacterium]|nr:lamin tail domain-containing protein [Bacteroidales bacterium]MBN2762812.1 lamin tail domain-containing protein [Bacteroidales bacterium]